MFTSICGITIGGKFYSQKDYSVKLMFQFLLLWYRFLQLKYHVSLKNKNRSKFMYILKRVGHEIEYCLGYKIQVSRKIFWSKQNVRVRKLIVNHLSAADSVYIAISSLWNAKPLLDDFRCLWSQWPNRLFLCGTFSVSIFERIWKYLLSVYSLILLWKAIVAFSASVNYSSYSGVVLFLCLCTSSRINSFTHWVRNPVFIVEVEPRAGQRGHPTNSERDRYWYS